MEFHEISNCVSLYHFVNVQDGFKYVSLMMEFFKYVSLMMEFDTGQLSRNAHIRLNSITHTLCLMCNHSLSI